MVTLEDAGVTVTVGVAVAGGGVVPPLLPLPPHAQIEKAIATRREAGNSGANRFMQNPSGLIKRCSQFSQQCRDMDESLLFAHQLD